MGPPGPTDHLNVRILHSGLRPKVQDKEDSRNHGWYDPYVCGLLDPLLLQPLNYGATRSQPIQQAQPRPAPKSYQHLASCLDSV